MSDKGFDSIPYRKVEFERKEKELLGFIHMRDTCIVAWKIRIAEAELELEKYHAKLDELRSEYLNS
jgi:hypothetical protein